jgi:Ca2+-binding RTX toxin-like protein
LGVSGHECCDSEIRVKDLGDDTYDGGPGRDVFHAGRASTTSVFIDLSAGRASSISLGEDTVLNLETFFGSPYDDTLIGDDGDNWLIGGGYPYTLGRPMGNDRLVGRGGDDVLEGLDGAVGSEYNDSVDAGGRQRLLHSRFR